ncbi:hypothetical protein JVU11DRAFT_1382 [Chiua virens]|nr:hypothetical protein JVU11DRAFT_1382 [Chiua virens]
MSSISFPHSGDADFSSSSSIRDSLQSQYYTPPGFDVSNSFQMNPHSAHPPRTPRPSTVTQPQFANMTINSYEESEEQTTEKDAPVYNADEDEDVDEEGERVAGGRKKGWQA